MRLVWLGMKECLWGGGAGLIEGSLGRLWVGVGVVSSYFFQVYDGRLFMERSEIVKERT